MEDLFGRNAVERFEDKVNQQVDNEYRDSYRQPFNNMDCASSPASENRERINRVARTPDKVTAYAAASAPGVILLMIVCFTYCSSITIKLEPVFIKRNTGWTKEFLAD